jgi:hypothetical protein
LKKLWFFLAHPVEFDEQSNNTKILEIGGKNFFEILAAEDLDDSF